MSNTKKSLTLQEHLHKELKQLIAVDHPYQDGKTSRVVTNNAAGLDPKKLLKLSQNDERRQNKVNVVSRLLDTFREDQTGIIKHTTDGQQSVQSDCALLGRIHGCVGSHWELLPPIYADPSDNNDNANSDSEMIEDFVSKESTDISVDKHHSHGKKRSELASSWLWTSENKDEKSQEEDTATAVETSPTQERIYPIIRGGGLRLPGLDWNKTFRKGYTVLVWVRPTLNCIQTYTPEGAAVRKQILYRFASSLHDNVVGSVGVCAILGQWHAVSCTNSSEVGSRTMLTATVAAYTLPNSDPMSHLYPSGKATKPPAEDGTDCDAKEKSAHERNMEYFQQHKHEHHTSSSNKGRLLKAKKQSKHSSMGSDKTSGKDKMQPSSSGGYVSAQLTLPADEWSLIGIQHTHPYLRRPELIISVNGEEIAKGELAYPVLDASITSADEEITGGISAMTLSGSSSASPRAQNGDALGALASVLSDSERKMLKRRGILAECTLLDGAFENGVLDENQQKLSCVLSVHSLALLSVTVPNVVLAMIAERGPLGDSASGSGLSFVIGPVPPNPQNRDAIVALLAGYGYYGNGGSGSSGIGVSGHIQDKYSAPPRSIGLPMSIGIAPGVTLRKGSRFSRESSSHESDESSHGVDSWIGSEKEFDAHTFLQSLIGRVILTFHSGDTHSLGSIYENNDISTKQRRIICQPSVAPSCIGGVDEVPKVGIIRPINPSPHSTSARLEVTGNSRYHNTTLKYIRKENNREQIEIAPSADKNSKYDGYPPVSFTRAIHASNAVNCALLPLRLALPKTGGVEVNSAQQALHAESFIHLSDLLSNQAQLMGLIIELINECILAGGSTIRDETLQSGCVHALSNLMRRVLIRGARLGLIEKGCKTNQIVEKSSSNENIDFDYEHDTSCAPVIPLAICKALTQLIDVCCGPVSINFNSLDTYHHALADPFRGLLRVRRTSDLALTSFFGLALDFDIVGTQDLTATERILASIAGRYCQTSGEGAPQEEPLYGSLLRSQMNIQYFLDSIRVRFDNSVSSTKQTEKHSDEERNALESIANSLSDILYSMLLSSLTSASGSAVTRGERDIGALVAAMTECSLGSVCARVALSAIGKLLVKCGVFSPQCIETSSNNTTPSHRRRDTVDLALENRLARNMLLCRYHDIVAPLLLSKSEPQYSIEPAASSDGKEGDETKQTVVLCNVGVVSNVGRLLDWTYDWRLCLLIFSWLSSLAGADERLSTSRNTGELITRAAQTGSLDGALIAKDMQQTGAEKSHLIAVLSHFLVMSPSGEKDVSTTINKAETTSRRLSVFMQLIPGIARVILSPSIPYRQKLVSAEILKGILSMLSLSIQSLYGNKKGGLLTSKPGSNEAAQRNRAKGLFVDAAKEYSPVLLQVVLMLQEPIDVSKMLNANSTAQLYASSEQSTFSNANAPADTIERIRTDSTSDKDWVDVHADADDLSPDATSPTKPAGSKANGSHQTEQQHPSRKIYTDLVSCQDIALYAVSRLVAQAMKYGGGEASTIVWRVIVGALAIEDTPNSERNDIADALEPTTKPKNTSSKQTLCHLVALVLSKFAKYHDKGTVRSHWNAEACAAVARLMDLVEEKKLLTNEVMQKFSIDQVRLIKSVLEIMKSGRENGGWLQVQDAQMSPSDEPAPNHVGKAVEEASAHSNYQLYNQQASTNHGQKSNSKLLLPILQSCLRLMLPSLGIIRSEAVVISATSAGKAPSTSVLLQLVCTELNDSITSAISGLLFSVSRDIFMNAIAEIKDCLDYHKHSSDTKAVKLCSELLLNVIKVMRQRYVNERNRKDNGSYEDEEENFSNQGEAVERLILGQEQVPTNDASDVDFLAFNGDASANQNVQMGFMQYKGLGSSLNRCFRELNEKPSLGTRCLGLSGFKTPEAKAELAFSILEPFISNWKKAMAHDDEEQELVDLFDESQEAASTVATQLLSSDAISRFSEAQSILKQQHYHLAFDYLVSRRFGRTAFTERLCWKTWMELVDVDSCNGLWERCIYEGGRDYYSKMTTLPMFPQFARFIPSYLDHSPSSLSVSTPPAPEIDLKGQGIKIVDITKKEVDEAMMDLFDENEEGVDDGQKDYQEEDLDVLFPNHRDSQVSAASAKLDDSERTDNGADATNDDDVTERGDSPSIKPTDSMNAPEHSNFHFASSSFSFPPDSSSLVSMGRGVKLCGGMMEEYYSSCLHVKPDCSRKCIVMLTETHLILEFEDGDGIVEGENESHQKKLRDSLHEDKLQEHDQMVLMEKALRPKAMRWNISEASHIYLRRYRLRDSALEIFFIPSAGATTGGTAFLAGSRSLFIDFGSGAWGNTRRDDAANAIMKRAPMQTVKQWPDKSGQFLHDELKKLTQAWTQGAISNFDYLSSLNCLSGRSYNDICQYPVFPWTLSNFTSETVPDLSDAANYRDLSKPIGALNELRLTELIDRFETFADPSIPPFMYGSHYSTSAGVVLHFLLRLHPFSTLHRQLQSGHFDVADRLFSSVQRTWEMCTGRSAAEVKELTPEFYCNPSFLRNVNELKLGTMQEGEVVNDVALPPWAQGSPEKFVEVMRLALESDIVSESLGDWVDLIFGYKQQGKHAIEAHNVFFYLTYYGSVDVASIEDEGLRLATECQIAHFGQCPMQLFYRPHVKKRDRRNRHNRQTLSETLGIYDSSQRNKLLPFMGSPMSYWVHLAAPPPGPHAPLISVRLTLSDRCLAVDAKGVYHFFRWAWKPEVADDEESEGGGGEEETSGEVTPYDAYIDKGCFVAQRELMSFRNIPCLPYTPMSSDGARPVTVSMSKTLFSNRTLLLILSDGDGKGALAMQLVDPVKGAIKGEVVVPSAHSDYITAIDMDPIGTAAGQGGVGGELAVVGSADGSMTMWRFISSHYWPLRPRLRMMGHTGSKVHAVAVSSALGICASISSTKCCIFDVGNGAMIRAFSPPIAACKDHLGNNLLDKTATQITTFANTPALCLSVMGYVAVVCSTKLIREDEALDEVFSIELMTLEGVHVGSKLLEPDRGLPNKLFSSVDGRALFVCAGRGVSVCLISSVQPLSFVDEWRLTEEDDDDYNSLAQQAIHDLDFGPTVSRPVVVASGCSDGSLRLHALQGISKWSLENQRNVVTSAVGSVLALPAQTVKNAIGGVAGFGSRFVGFGKEIGKEAFQSVKERDGPMGFFRKK